ncbi:MAG: 3'(2'),5'-bisphosphate nucleotidase CysQ, partial [Gammaproteobacteria bacterium]|nr:3'(2'),5'-bisphosphate nucleotidase CysQ [Gammaproteobacteria bacterium]
RDHVYFGYRGGGSYLAEQDGHPESIKAAKTASWPRRVVGSRSHRGSSLEDYLDRVGEHIMVPMGSSLKL